MDRSAPLVQGLELSLEPRAEYDLVSEERDAESCCREDDHADRQHIKGNVVGVEFPTQVLFRIVDLFAHWVLNSQVCC